MGQQGGAWWSQYESGEGGGGAYDGMALPDRLLQEYYSQKARAENQVQKDSLLVYDYEGQGSPVGSVGCCSLLEDNGDLQFLNDLGPKFKTLAEVCRGERFQTESFAPPPPRPVVSMPTAASSVITSVVSNAFSEAQPKAPCPAPIQTPAPIKAPAPIQAPAPIPAQRPPKVTHVEKTVVNGTARTDQSAAVRQERGGGSQTILLQQQPVYYSTVQPMMQPMMQPMQYVVEQQQVPSMQGMVMVTGPPAGGMVMQGQQVLTGTLGRRDGGMVLLERGGAGGQGGGLEGGLIQMGNTSGPQSMMLVEGQMMQGEHSTGPTVSLQNSTAGSSSQVSGGNISSTHRVVTEKRVVTNQSTSK
ncbi:hypothetical protein UPYG_G00030960 [Umbra pygmaea]|uniref:Cadherin Y-type LIR-motif domain-containing protein n=1 Tax=Umbra pygmaea TaxID=75934 RepID=A0ABD0Y9U5_UMBPY